MKLAGKFKLRAIVFIVKLNNIIVCNILTKKIDGTIKF